MQLGGIGNSHSAAMHQVTACIHSHESGLEGGPTKTLTSPSSAAQPAMRVHQEPEQISFAEWAQQLFRSSRQKLLGFWRGSDTPSQGETGEKNGTRQVMAQESDTSVTKAGRSFPSTPYFAAVEPEKASIAEIPVFQKVKQKVKAVAGQLANHLPGQFFNFMKQNSSQAKKENSQADLRKRSKYREEELEIDCILTDESYLMDSYDRKGEYSQLTTQK